MRRWGREAKARLSALVRHVREGRSVIISAHGVPAAELCPVNRTVRTQKLDERLAELEARGLVVPAHRSPGEGHRVHSMNASASSQRPSESSARAYSPRPEKNIQSSSIVRCA